MEKIKMIQLTTTENRKVLIQMNINLSFIEMKNNIRVLEGVRILYDVKDSMESIINKLERLQIIISE